MSGENESSRLEIRAAAFAFPVAEASRLGAFGPTDFLDDFAIRGSKGWWSGYVCPLGFGFQRRGSGRQGQGWRVFRIVCHGGKIPQIA